MATGQYIVTQALVDLGIYSPGETPSASESFNGLTKLNMMVDNWSGARDLVYEILLQSFALSPNQQSYPIGPTAAAPFNVQRPNKIEGSFNILITSGSGAILRHEGRLISEAEWFSLDDRNAQGTVPNKLYFDPQVPNAVLNLHPIPQVSAGDNTKLEIGVWQFVQQFALLTTNANLPPAYLRAVVLGLELELGPTYGQVNPAILQQRSSQFAEAIAVVRQLNSQVQMVPLAPVQGQNPQQQQIPPQLAQLLQGAQQGK